MIEFLISQEEAKKVSGFAGPVVQALNKINSLEEEALFEAKGETLTIHAYGANATGKFAGAETGLEIKSLNVSGKSWFTFSLAKMITGFSKAPEGDITIKVDEETNQIWFYNSVFKEDVNLAFGYIDRVSESEAQETIGELADLTESKEKIATIHITPELIKDIENISGVLSICQYNTDAVEIAEHQIRTSDSATVLHINYPDAIAAFTEGHERFPIDARSISLIKSINTAFGDYDIEVFKDDPAVITLIDLPGAVKIGWTNTRFSLEYPSDEEMKTLSPDEECVTTVTFNTDEFAATIAKFQGIFEAQNWKWDQIKFDWDAGRTDRFGLSYETNGARYKNTAAVTFQSNTETEEKFSFYMPTKYLPYIFSLAKKDQKDGTIKMRFNSIAPRDPHGQVVTLETENVKVFVCKLIMAPR